LALTIAELALLIIERADTHPLPDVPVPSSAIVADADPLAIQIPDALAERIRILQGARVMPRSWQKRKLDRLDGMTRKRPFLWHEVLHVFDNRKLRRTKPFPEKQVGRLRIVALGDSLTYGAAVPSEWSWPALLETWLAEEVSVEVINLGISGHASEDIVALARDLLPQLAPDLVLYAVCLNDFLPSRASQPLPWQIPLPDDVKGYFTDRTRVGQSFEQGYGSLLIRVGLRAGFYAEMAGAPEWPQLRARFARDVAELQKLVESLGLPPVVSLVLDPQPDFEGPGRRLAVAAEEALSAGGLDVIASEPYYRRYDGRPFGVSRWEVHPNEQAMLVYASLFRAALRGRGLLERYR
jgi:lysophospholipase L1-like esterase